jgi:hypothetical protein
MAHQKKKEKKKKKKGWPRQVQSSNQQHELWTGGNQNWNFLRGWIFLAKTSTWTQVNLTGNWLLGSSLGYHR